MSDSKKRARRIAWERTKREMKEHKAMLALYIILRTLVVVVMVQQFVQGSYNNVFLCLLTLLLFMIPVFVDKRLNIKLPSALEVIILLFIFAAEILGEINEYYILIPYWDTMLHVINGFLMAAIGFAMIDILNSSPRLHFNMSPIFVAVVAFCFSMTIGVIWEFFEFGMDLFFKTDMQKDTLCQAISTVNLNPDGANIAVTVQNIADTVIHGTVGGEAREIVIPGGYLDIGLFDTIEDMFVNCIGAIVFSAFGYVYIKRRGKRGGRLVKGFVPIMKGSGENNTNDEKE